ncbi:MAG: hypothetical protein HWN80_12635, partial [Candidatus Lokiarchaeota archaeon]|nr:hypothetical protein [Candidatus Lokiarchaeota archaeon]
KPKEEPPKPKEEPPVPKEEPPVPKKEPPILKKPPTPDAPKVESLVKPQIPIAVPPPKGPPNKIDAVEKEQQQEILTKPIDQEAISKQKDTIEAVTPSPPKVIKQPEIPKEEKPSEPDIIIKPKIQHTKVGLNLNPEDFMVKQRPKTVTTVPKDAKNKLKTSPFAHVSNPVVPKMPTPVSPIELVNKKTPSGFIPPSKSEKPKVKTKPNIPMHKSSEIPKKPVPPPVPVSSTKLIKSKEQEVAVKSTKAPTSITPPILPQKVEKPPVQAPSGAVDTQQKAKIEKSLMDLRIKKANITKMSLNFDMKELTGEITPEELETKKQKLKTIEANIDQQIQDLEKMLGK